jgi:hypothetical protein
MTGRAVIPTRKSGRYFLIRICLFGFLPADLAQVDFQQNDLDAQSLIFLSERLPILGKKLCQAPRQPTFDQLRAIQS